MRNSQLVLVSMVGRTISIIEVWELLAISQLSRYMWTSTPCCDSLDDKGFGDLGKHLWRQRKTEGKHCALKGSVSYFQHQIFPHVC